MRTQDKIFYSAVAAIMVLILFLAVFGNNGFRDLTIRKKQHRELVNKNHRISMENKNLLDEINRLKNDLDYVEAVARKELGLVSEKELVFKPK